MSLKCNFSPNGKKASVVDLGWCNMKRSVPLFRYLVLNSSRDICEYIYDIYYGIGMDIGGFRYQVNGDNNKD